MSQKYPITISSWTLGDQCTFEERVAAAKNAGFEGIGLRAETYVDALNEGLFDADILALLDKYGMKVTEVEYIVQWADEHRSYEQKYKEQMCFHIPSTVSQLPWRIPSAFHTPPLSIPAQRYPAPRRKGAPRYGVGCRGWLGRTAERRTARHSRTAPLLSRASHRSAALFRRRSQSALPRPAAPAPPPASNPPAHTTVCTPAPVR